MWLLKVCFWLFVAAIEWMQQPLPVLEPAGPAPTETDSTVPPGGWKQAACPWRYPVGECALDGGAR